MAGEHRLNRQLSMRSAGADQLPADKCLLAGPDPLRQVLILLLHDPYLASVPIVVCGSIARRLSKADDVMLGTLEFERLAYSR